MPSVEQRDLRALLLHRLQWVRMRTQVMNALQGIALAHGLRRGTQLRGRRGQAALAAVPLQPHAGDRRSELQALFRHLHTHVEQLTARVTAEAQAQTLCF
jgi:transposase